MSITLLTALLCWAPAQFPQPASSRVSSQAEPAGELPITDRRPRVQLETLEGELREVPLGEFQTDAPGQLGAVFLRYLGLPEPAPLAGLATAEVEVRLSSHGDRLVGALRAGDGDHVQVELVGGALLTLGIEEITAIVFPGRLSVEGGMDIVAAEEGDRLFRRRGLGVDRVDGLFQSFEVEGVRFESGLGERLYPWSEVAALFIEDLGEGGKSDDGAGVPVVIDLHGQSRLHGRLLSMDGNGCRIATRADADLLLPAATIAEVGFDDGSYRFLSDLAPADLGPISPTGDDLGMVWPPRMDRARTGVPLRAGGRTWARGIGVQAPSRITWDLDGKWTRLRGHVAIDDSVLALPKRGSVVFRVLVDGEKRFESPVMRGGDVPLDLGSLDVSGARELVLEVDPSTDLWVADRADWLRPILVGRP